MTRAFSWRTHSTPHCVALLAMLAALVASAPAGAAEPRVAAKIDLAALEKPVPESVADLLAIESQVQSVARTAGAATVGLRVGRAQGSGVIVSEDGLILTAAHVVGEPGQQVVATLSDGRKIRGKSLGVNPELDAGMVKLIERGDWPVAELAEPDSVEVGEWCVAVGHPGGWREDRTAPVRLGRIVAFRGSVIQTDCTLVGGDSGGPLFDMQGRVIGIHSRIGPSTAWNFHVPISIYRDGWDEMVAGEVWGNSGSGALLGVVGDDDPEGCLITIVAPGLPAEDAGLQVGDIITHLNGRRVRGFKDLTERVREHDPGERINIEVLRDEERLEFRIKLADRADYPIQ